MRVYKLYLLSYLLITRIANIFDKIVIFTTRRYAIVIKRGTVYAVVVCLPVCPSATSRCSTETAKLRLTVGSRRQRHIIALGLHSF